MSSQPQKLVEEEPSVITTPLRVEAITLETIRANPRVQTFIRKSDQALAMVGYTEHGERHAKLVAKNARRILQELGYNEREAERSEEHTSELQSRFGISYAVFCLKKKHQST